MLDALEALSARQKEALWRGFLQDGTQPMEFQWLWDAYREGAVDSLLEWELTLQLTLEALGLRGGQRGGPVYRHRAGRFGAQL